MTVPAPLGPPSGPDPQLAAAVAARARMERLLSTPSPFAYDDGSAMPEVTAALEATSLPWHEYLDGLWAVLVASRLIVPVVAHSLPDETRRPAALAASPEAPAATTVPTHEPHTQDACRDAAALAVELDDGHRALPVFTSAEALSAWRGDARPVPVEPQQAAQVAVALTSQLWVLDPGTRDLRLPRPAVIALAGGEDWVPSWRNDPVQLELSAQLEQVEGVTAIAFEPGQQAELRVLVRIDASNGRSAVARTVEGCQHVLVNPAWGELIDTVELCPLPG